MQVREISLADVARALDAMLDGQMTVQARIAAHLVAAAEAAGHDAAGVLEILEAVAANTVLDEFWITDEQGVACLTNVRDETGAPMPFRFNPDPVAQPQASAFYVLLESAIDSDDVITQSAQGREIDQDIYKYVGVGGVDRHRIVQVGNALAFEEQGLLSDDYTSPVMTAVLAAFDEPDLLDNAYTSHLAEIRTVFEEILGRQMVVQATLVESLVVSAEDAGWSPQDINGKLRRIVNSTPIGEIHIADRSGGTVYSSLPQLLESNSPGGLPGAGDLTSLIDGMEQVFEHPAAPRSSDDAIYKYVTIRGANGARFVHLGFPIADNTLVSPRFNAARRQ